MRRVIIRAAVITTIVFAGSRAEAQKIKVDVPAGMALTTVTEPAPKKSDDKPAKGFFKELRPGSCKPSTFSAPVSSWPTRGEPLIAVCRP